MVARSEEQRSVLAGLLITRPYCFELHHAARSDPKMPVLLRVMMTSGAPTANDDAGRLACIATEHDNS